jgi:hypothetical protein
LGENELAIVKEISKDSKITISELSQIKGLVQIKADIGRLIRKIEDLILESKLGEKLGEKFEYKIE